MNTPLYRDMDRAALDAAYDNTRAVTDSAAILADWEVRSARLAAARPEHLDLRYGSLERNRIDYFSAGRRGPVLVFIHGGYWQMRAKETFRFLASGPLSHGIDVAFVAYTLAPAKRLEGIVAEVRSAIAWLAPRVAELGGDASRLYVSGWSAGGHLAAMTIDEPGVRGALAMSGIFDLEPIRLCYLNDKLRLDDDEVLRNSPLLERPLRAGRMMIACGGSELGELQRQSQAFAAARSNAGLPGQFTVLSGHNHFTILEELASRTGALTDMVCTLVAS